MGFLRCYGQSYRVIASRDPPMNNTSFAVVPSSGRLLLTPFFFDPSQRKWDLLMFLFNSTGKNRLELFLFRPEYSFFQKNLSQRIEAINIHVIGYLMY